MSRHLVRVRRIEGIARSVAITDTLADRLDLVRLVGATLIMATLFVALMLPAV